MTLVRSKKKVHFICKFRLSYEIMRSNEKSFTSNLISVQKLKVFVCLSLENTNCFVVSMHVHTRTYMHYMEEEKNRPNAINYDKVFFLLLTDTAWRVISLQGHH